MPFGVELMLVRTISMTAGNTSSFFNRKFRRQGRAMSTWPNVYMKVMRALKAHYPELDFATMTREEVRDQNLPCRTVASAVEAGYLEKVPGYEKLDREL